MGNLGMYQWMTFVSKKLGGPKTFLLLVAAGGYGVGKIVELTGKAGIKMLSNKQQVNSLGKDETIYTVKTGYTVCGAEKSHCEFKAGDQYRILCSDGQAVFIEKLGDDNNPYCVSKEILQQITR